MAERHSDQLPPDTRGSFTFGTRLGLTFVVQMAFISALAVSILLTLIMAQAVRRWRKRNICWPAPIHIFFISLLACDLIQAIGSIFDIKWVHLAGVLEGPYCSAQGAFKQMGDTGVALSTMSIAVQTYGIIVRRWAKPRTPFLALIVVAGIWLFMVLITSVGYALHHSKASPYYGNTRYWCWIPNPPYEALGIALEYGWMWLAALVNIGLYIPVSLVLYREYRNSNTMTDTGSTSAESSTRALALQMLFYPMIYIITVVPISIARFMQFQRINKPPPFAWTAFAAVCLASSGVCNVCLYTYTRPSLLPSRDAEDPRAYEAFEKESETALNTMRELQPHDRRLSSPGTDFDPYFIIPTSPRMGAGGLPD